MAEAIKSSDDLGRVVRQRRRALGLTQEDLALASGTGRRFVIDLERGKATVRFTSTFAVLRALGLDLSVTERTAHRSES